MNCPVCFGGEDTAMRESLNAGIGVLMGVTVIVLACFARFVIKLVLRAKASDADPLAPAGSVLQK